MPEEKKGTSCCSCRGAFWEDLGVHGIRRLVRARGACGRSSIWVILLLFSLALLAFNMMGCIFHYLTYPTVTSFGIMEPSSHSGPAVTVCNLNSMRVSRLQENGWLPSVQELYGQTIQGQRAGAMDSRDLYTKTGHQIEDMLLRCTHGGEPCDLHNFTMTLTEHGVCHSLPQLGDRQLDMLLNIERYEYSGLSTERVGLLVILYDQRHQPVLSPYYITASPGLHTTADIYISHVMRLGTGETCRSSPSPDGDCLASCVKYKVDEKCGCVPFWAATGNTNRGDGVTCKMHSNVQCAEKEVEKVLHGAKRRTVCDCKPDCDYKSYSTDVFQSVLDSTDPMRYLSDTQKSKISYASVRAQNIRYRSALSADSGSVHSMSALSRTIDELRYQIETLKRNIGQVRHNVDNMNDQLRKRTWFHFQVGLNGNEKTIRHGFIPHWEMVERQFLWPLVSQCQLVLFNFNNVVSKLEKTSSSEVGMRRTLYVSMEETLSARMELAIQGLGNFTKVYYSLLNMKPSSTYILTPQRKYDAALLPVVAISDVGDALRDEYTTIADHLANEMKQMLAMKNILEDAYISPTGFNKTEYHNTGSIFLQRNLQLQTHLDLFKDKVINKLQDGLVRQSEYFKKINATFFSTSAKLSSLLLEATELLDDISLYHYPHLVDFAQNAQIYLSNEDKLMRDLEQGGLSNAVRDSTDALLKNIAKFKSLDGATSGMWEKFSDHSLQLWTAMLNNDNLRPFYAKLNADVKNMIQNPSSANSLRLIFAHNKLLGKSETEISEINPDDFYFLLNADFPVTSEHGKEVEIRETTGQYGRLTDVSLQIQDIDKSIRRSYDAIVTILENFREETKVGGEFVRDNIVSISLRLASTGHDEVRENHSYPIVQLLTDIGMLLPIYLGASLLSIFEALDILCSCICCKHKEEAEQLDSPNTQNSPRHVTFHFPETGNHVSSPAKPVLKRPRPDQQCDYYPNDVRGRMPTYDDTPIEML